MTSIDKNLSASTTLPYIPSTTNNYPIWSGNISTPKTVTKEKKTVTKEFNDKGKVVKETTVTETETTSEHYSYPYTYPYTWTSNSAETTFIK